MNNGDKEPLLIPTYLDKRAKGNESPLLHLPLGGEMTTERFLQLSEEDFRALLYYNVKGRASDALFRGLLLTPNRMKSGRSLNPLYEGFTEPAVKGDWEEWIALLFQEGSNLPALAHLLSKPPFLLPAVDLWISLPYPERRQTAFGQVEGRNLSFEREEDRLYALAWWIGTFQRRFNDRFGNEGSGLKSPLRLRGFRWAREAILKNDVDLVKKVADQIHREGAQFLWLTNFGSSGVTDWEQMGFDLTLLHPNYYGNTENGWEWIDYAAYFASTYHCGLQLTYGKGMLYNQTHLYDYLNRGLPEYRDYMKRAFLLFQFDGISLTEVMRDDFPLYANLYLFIKEKYKKIAYPGIGY